MFCRYHKHANVDSEIVYRRTQQILQQIGQSPDSINESELKLFCHHAYHLHVTRGSSIADEYTTNTSATNEIGNFTLYLPPSHNKYHHSENKILC